MVAILAVGTAAGAAFGAVAASYLAGGSGSSEDGGSSDGHGAELPASPAAKEVRGSQAPRNFLRLLAVGSCAASHSLATTQLALGPGQTRCSVPSPPRRRRRCLPLCPQGFSLLSLDQRRRTFFKYEKRLRELSGPDKAFEYFASLEGDGGVYMQPSDMMRAVVPVYPPRESDSCARGRAAGRAPAPPAPGGEGGRGERGPPRERAPPGSRGRWLRRIPCTGIVCAAAAEHCGRFWPGARREQHSRAPLETSNPSCAGERPEQGL